MKDFLKVLAAVVVSFIAGAYVHKCQSRKQGEPERPSGYVVDTITYVDTIPYFAPQPIQEARLGNRITLLPVFIPRDKAISDSCNTVVENILASCNNEVQNISSPSVGHLTGPDSVMVEIPITQKEYEGAEYHAWVSGYDPNLDSIFVFPRHDVVTIREPPNKQKRWGIGVFAGYGMTPHGFQPCAGISVNYNLWNFLVEPSE